MELALDAPVLLGHLVQAFHDFAAQLRTPSLVQPIAHQLRHTGAPVTCGHGLLEFPKEGGI